LGTGRPAVVVAADVAAAWIPPATASVIDQLHALESAFWNRPG
jgi:hypothetical protein